MKKTTIIFIDEEVEVYQPKRKKHWESLLGTDYEAWVEKYKNKIKQKHVSHKL